MHTHPPSPVAPWPDVKVCPPVLPFHSIIINTTHHCLVDLVPLFLPVLLSFTLTIVFIPPSWSFPLLFPLPSVSAPPCPSARQGRLPKIQSVWCGPPFFTYLASEPSSPLHRFATVCVSCLFFSFAVLCRPSTSLSASLHTSIQQVLHCPFSAFAPIFGRVPSPVLPSIVIPSRVLIGLLFLIDRSRRSEKTFVLTSHRYSCTFGLLFSLILSEEFLSRHSRELLLPKELHQLRDLQGKT